MPLYMLGFMGATRRLDHYDASTGWQPLFITVGIGALIILCGGAIQLYGLFSSIKNRNKHRDLTGDPWNGRTLEWSIPSPPPIYNFAVIPTVDHLDPLWAIKRGEAPAPTKDYEDIPMPRNTPVAFYIGVSAMFLGFAMTWYIWWLAALSAASILISLLARFSSPMTTILFQPKKCARWKKNTKGDEPVHVPSQLTVHSTRDPHADTTIPDPHQDSFSKTILGFGCT